MVVLEFYMALQTQCWTLVIAAIITFIGLWLRSNSYGAEGGWTLALIIVLCLVAFFPNGFHSIFNTGAT